MFGANLLFLDDLPERQQHARKLWPACSIVSTAADCIAALSRQSWVTVCLDHDLNGTNYEDPSRPDTGMEVVRWIVANRPSISEIICHSHNEDATIEMARQLKGAGYAVVKARFGQHKIWKAPAR